MSSQPLKSHTVFGKAMRA